MARASLVFGNPAGLCFWVVCRTPGFSMDGSADFQGQSGNGVVSGWDCIDLVWRRSFGANSPGWRVAPGVAFDRSDQAFSIRGIFYGRLFSLSSSEAAGRNCLPNRVERRECVALLGDEVVAGKINYGPLPG